MTTATTTRPATVPADPVADWIARCGEPSGMLWAVMQATAQHCDEISRDRAPELAERAEIAAIVAGRLRQEAEEIRHLADGCETALYEMALAIPAGPSGAGLLVTAALEAHQLDAISARKPGASLTRLAALVEQLDAAERKVSAYLVQTIAAAKDPERCQRLADETRGEATAAGLIRHHVEATIATLTVTANRAFHRRLDQAEPIRERINRSRIAIAEARAATLRLSDEIERHAATAQRIAYVPEDL
jgi:hypothetical protein